MAHRGKRIVETLARGGCILSRGPSRMTQPSIQQTLKAGKDWKNGVFNSLILSEVPIRGHELLGSLLVVS